MSLLAFRLALRSSFFREDRYGEEKKCKEKGNRVLHKLPLWSESSGFSAGGNKLHGPLRRLWCADLLSQPAVAGALALRGSALPSSPDTEALPRRLDYLVRHMPGQDILL